MSNVYIMYRDKAVYAVFDSRAAAELELSRIIGSHPKARIQKQAVWSGVITQELNEQDIQALRDCVTKS